MQGGDSGHLQAFVQHLKLRSAGISLPSSLVSSSLVSFSCLQQEPHEERVREIIGIRTDQGTEGSVLGAEQRSHLGYVQWHPPVSRCTPGQQVEESALRFSHHYMIYIVASSPFA